MFHLNVVAFLHISCNLFDMVQEQPSWRGYLSTLSALLTLFLHVTGCCILTPSTVIGSGWSFPHPIFTLGALAQLVYLITPNVEIFYFGMKLQNL